VRATAGASHLFNPPLSFPIDRRAPNTSASIVNLFYWTNFAHDYLFGLGFDEAAGNFQQQNFSGRGLGGDPVIAVAQHGPGRNQASFTSGDDGTPGRLEMYLWDGGYDGAFDQTVILHEYVHGLSSRLVKGPNVAVAIHGLQTIGMYEGWSDWYALSMLAEADDDLDAPYVVGGYVARNFSGGVRHFPYSTDLRANPLTYSDVDFRQSDVFAAYREHDLGEVWCSILWEVRANFIREHGFAQGRARVERLVTEGMKLTFNSASFVDARNALLAADRVLTGGEDQALIWRGFAKRGVGESAFTFGGRSVFVREAFDVPAWCESAGTPAFDSPAYDETRVEAWVSIRDADLAATSTARVEVSTSSGDALTVQLDRVPGSPGLLQPPVRLERSTVVAGDDVLQVSRGDTISAEYRDAFPEEAVRVTSARVLDRVILVEDDAESGPSKWKASGWSIRIRGASGEGHCWTDSAGGAATTNTTSYLQIARPFDLRASVGTSLSFSHAFDTEPGFDHCFVEARAKGRPWEIVALFTGFQRDFVQTTIDLSRFDGLEKVKIRFAFRSDRIIPSDGWYLDDVRLITTR
jgi:hypothetical protein